MSAAFGGRLVDALKFITDAIKEDPRLRLASGVALLGAVIAVVLSFTGGDRDLALFGGVFVVGFMILLAIFIAVTKSETPPPYVAGFLIWSISIAFVASICFIMTSYFFCWPQPLGKGCAQRSYARGEITDIPPLTKKRIGVVIEDDAMGAFNRSTKAFHFVVLANRIGRQSMTVTVRNPDEGVEQDEDIKVHLSCVLPFVHSDRLMEWRYREIDRVQPDGKAIRTPALYRDDRKIGEFGLIAASPCNDAPAVAQPRTAWSSLLPTMSAFAQTPEVLPKGDITSAITDLTAIDTPTRRAARATLAKGSVEAVPAILDAMRKQPHNYQIQLGGSVAMTEMLRQNKADAGRIAAVFHGMDDRELLLKSAGHSDRTLRIYASEFLYDLGDADVSRKALELAAKTQDENARYNLLLVAQGGWDKLAAPQKAAAAGDLAKARATAGPLTLKLFEKLQ